MMTEATELAITIAHRMNGAITEDNYPLGVARNVRRMQEVLIEIATQCVEDGIRAGLTQKALADALGIPPSALAGAKREFGA